MRAIAAEELLVVLFSSGLCRCYTQRTHTHSLTHWHTHPTYRSSTDNIATTIESGTLVYSFDRLRVKNLYYNAVRASRTSRPTAPPIERAHLACASAHAGERVARDRVEPQPRACHLPCVPTRHHSRTIERPPSRCSTLDDRLTSPLLRSR